MSLTVAPGVARGAAPLLQPLYYASSLFVDPMRDDINRLLVAFVTAYAKEPLEPEKPFELFKTIWKDQGWGLVHLKVLDARARPVFISNVARLFIERMEPVVHHPLIRLGALFGLYTFYSIQPEVFESNVRAVQYITLTIDSYEQILVFPATLEPRLRSYATYIVSQLLSQQVFHILPHSSLGAQRPRTLPHTTPLLTRDIEEGPKKKTGRPSQVTQSQRADKALSEIEAFDSHLLSNPPDPHEYLALKKQLRDQVSSETLQAAETLTMERIEAAERHVKDKNLPLDDREGLERLRRTLTQSTGLLGLLEQHTTDE